LVDHDTLIIAYKSPLCQRKFSLRSNSISTLPDNSLAFAPGKIFCCPKCTNCGSIHRNMFSRQHSFPSAAHYSGTLPSPFSSLPLLQPRPITYLTQTRHRHDRAPDNDASIRSHLRPPLLHCARPRCLHDPHPRSTLLLLRRPPRKQSRQITRHRSRRSCIWLGCCDRSEQYCAGDVDCWTGCEGYW
jgi:hypothetical protein